MTKKKAVAEQAGETPTFSRDIERIVLGCMLNAPENFKSVFEKKLLSEKDFYFYEHQPIYQAMQALYEKGLSSDVHLLAEHLKRKGELEKIGGVSFLVSLASLVGTSSYFESYVSDLKEVSARRFFVNRCRELQGLALSEKNISSVIALATESFSTLAKTTSQQKSRSIIEISRGEGSASFLETLREKKLAGQKKGEWRIPGIPTGFSSLDMALGGLREENLIIIAARPSVGKTAFALNLLRHLGAVQKIPCAFFSLEMTSMQLFLRLSSTQSGVSALQLENGQISDTELEQIESAIQDLEKSPIFINDSCYELSKMVAHMRILAEEHGVRAFFIDYVGLIRPSREREIKAYEIGDITRTLKNFANETRIPIVCLAQLNRQAEGGKPQLSMLKDSGNLEQDADSVLFLHRQDPNEPNDNAGQIQVIVSKNRHGPTLSKSFQFKKEIGLISENFGHPISLSWD